LLVFLRSLKITLVAILIVPAVLASTVLLLDVLHMSFNIMTLGGMAAAVGLIVDDAIVMIEHIIRRLRQRSGELALTVREAAIDASSARFRPIVLTAISTVLGMIPIAPTVFWGPMAFAIMGGLLVATVLTLIFLPTLYVAWFDGREKMPAEPVKATPST